MNLRPGRTVGQMVMLVLLLLPKIERVSADEASLKTKNTELQKRLRVVEAENALLRRSLEAKNREVAELRSELARLKALLDKAGIDTRQPPAPLPKPGQARRSKEANSAVAQAIHKCSEALAGIGESDATHIQKRKEWLRAAKELDAVLRRNRIRITYTIKDVGFETKHKTAWLSIASATIKSSDPGVPDVVLGGFRHIRISASEAQAAKITKDSKLTLQGMPALNVDFSKPAAEQPAQLWPMSGYRPVGWLPRIGRSNPLMIRNNSLLLLDGIARKIR